jgi:parallel beta-helix repeat protein
MRKNIIPLVLAVIFLLLLAGSASAEHACVADDGSGDAYYCGDEVLKSCTFNGSVSCTDTTRPGLEIGADNIVIDGDGYKITGNEDATVCDCAAEGDPTMHSGITNVNGYDNVLIKNLEIEKFCTGIVLKGGGLNKVTNNTVFDCSIHDNGNNTCSGCEETSTHGIHLTKTEYSTIMGNDIYNNKGTGDSCSAGGNGIFVYACGGLHNNITCNYLHNNRASGIFLKKGAKFYNISYNNASANSDSGISLKCKKSDENVIEYNNASGNVGTGIFIGGKNNTIRYNTANNNDWYGIDMGRSDGSYNNKLYENTVCGNGVADISTCGPECYGNHGGNNTCDTCSNYHDEGETCCTHSCLPDLVIVDKDEDWVVAGSTYNIIYAVKNIGNKEAGASTTSIRIDGAEEATDSVPELVAGASYTNTLGPFTMSGTSDTIEVCADCENNVTECNETNNCLENEFCVCGCVSATQTFVCGDTVTKSCVFNGNMTCDSKYGLKIGTNGIIIDGGGYVLDGVSPGACDGFGIQRTGIYNKAHDDIVIKNLGIKSFCNGIYFKFDADGGDEVERTTIENCEIHHNGGDTGGDNSVHGIKAIGVFDSVIRNCTIHHNTGKGTSCEAGGNGIFLRGIDGYGAWNNTITENEIYGNRKGGFFTKMMCEVTEVSYNKLWGNGQGGIILRCKKSETHDIHHNNASYNYGDGIFVGGPDNTLRDNVVNNNTAGLNISGTDVVGDGDGIDMGRNDGSYNNELYNNTVCGNEGIDMDTYDVGSGTTGDNNTCDTCSNYHDEGETCCTFDCPGDVDLIVIDKSESWIDTLNKTYAVTYTVKNAGNSTACESTTSIYVDGILEKTDSIGVIGPGESYIRTVGPFTMTGNEDTIGVCADEEGVVNETDETNNCLENVFIGVTLPDMVIINKTEDWVSLENKTYNVTYTVKNIGTVDANASTTSIIIDGTEVATDSVGLLQPQATHTAERGPFTMSGESDTVRICADNASVINESNEDNNCQQNTFEHPGVPDLVITRKYEEWVVSAEPPYNEYNITYTVKNIGTRDAGASTTAIIIDEVEKANDSVGTLGEGESCTNTLGPFTMSGENDTVRICADKNNDVAESNEDNNCSENVFEYSGIGCVAADGTLFRCGNTVTKNCTFNGDMSCPFTDGLKIGANNVTIEGSNSVLDGVECTPEALSTSRCGIYNPGYDDVTIKNLEVKGFCTGMYLTSGGGEEGYVYRNTIENCNVHHNGNATSSGNPHGITLKYVFNSTIRNNSVHDQLAHVDPNPGCEDGGNGLFLNTGDYNLVTQNRFYNNTKGGLFIKMKPKYWNISYNHIYGNGQGGIILRCKLCDFNLIEHNNVSDNYGSGIFIGGNNNTLRNNSVCNNRDGCPYYEDSIGGHGYGIFIGRSDGSCYNELYENKVCENDYKDIYVVTGVTGNTGDENTCDMCKNYNDTSAPPGECCTYSCPTPSAGFDTGAPVNSYPSIRGTHNGTIKLNHTVTIYRMYTYPCFKTDGHSEFVAFYNSSTGAQVADGTWIGTYLGPYQWITFDKPFTLEAGVTYNYTIITGSYPQIIHQPSLTTPNGTIRCTKFTDANGKEHNNWVPAIRLWRG